MRKLCDKDCENCDLEECLQKIPPYAWWMIEEQRTEQSKEQRRRYVKRKRELCIAFGVCRECMAKDAKVNKYCTECFAKMRKHNEIRRNGIHRSERVSYGLCYFCGQPAEKGFKTCVKHHEMARNNILHTDFSVNKNHVWRRKDREMYDKRQHGAGCLEDDRGAIHSRRSENACKSIEPIC